MRVWLGLVVYHAAAAAAAAVAAAAVAAAAVLAPTRVYREYTRGDEGLRTVCWLRGAKAPHLPHPPDTATVARWQKAAAEFRAAFARLKPFDGCPPDRFPDPGVVKARLSDLTLVVPLGQDDVRHAFVLLESLALSDSYPAEVLFVTNLVADGEANDEVEARVRQISDPCRFALDQLSADQLIQFETFRSVLKDVYADFGTNVRWALHSGRRGAAVNRWMGAILANTTYVAYHDSDDVLFPDSLRVRYEYMTSASDVGGRVADVLLTSGEWVFLEEAETKREPTRQESIQKVMDLYLKHLCLPVKPLTIERLFAPEFYAENDETFHRSFGPLAYQSYMPGSLAGFPNFQHSLTCYDAERDVSEYKSLVSELQSDPTVYDVTNRVPRADLDPLLRLREEQDIRYLHTVCSEHYQSREQWVDRCVNGWAIGKTAAVRAVLPTSLAYGEDSLVNFLHFARGHYIVCDEAQRAGIYIRNGNRSILDS